MSERQISDAALVQATGKGWPAWLRTLDKWGARKKPHKQIASWLQEEHGLSGWWAQTVTVQYERERGLRKTGQVETGDFQVGVTKTLAVDPETAWRRIVGGKGLAAWLGEGAPRSLREGQEASLADGTQVSVRVVRAGSHVRLRWQPKPWKKPSTLQVRVVPRTGDRAAVTFHHEGLPDQRTRERMRSHWKERLARLDE